MQKNLNYTILPDLKLILEHYSGHFDIANAVELRYTESQDKNYNPDFYFIIDIRGLDPIFNELDVKNYINGIKKVNNVIGKTNTAVLTKTPKQFVLGAQYKMYLDETPRNYKIFSTLQAVIKWLNIQAVEYCRIHETLQDLRYSRTN